MRWMAITVVLWTLCCARKVVLNPDAVREKNSADWTVEKQPSQPTR